MADPAGARAFGVADTVVTPNTPAFLTEPMIDPTGFREYDARWRYPEQINLIGVQALGLALATQLFEMGGARPRVVVGCDYRAHALAVKQALTLGLTLGGAEALDIGVCVTPMAYFAREHLDAPAVAMVTASHNPDGWTGVKMGARPPLTHGPAEMARLKTITLEGRGVARHGGAWRPVGGVRAAWLDDLAGDFRLSRPLKVVCACGNGAAGLVAPALLRRIGATVVERHCTPDYAFPHYNPNPESPLMLRDMGAAAREAGADLALGFDGDGDRCGVTDGEGRAIFADVVGVLLARALLRDHPGATFVVDVKSTGLYRTDPALAGARIDMWKTGHSHMKARVAELGALAGFEKSGHFFFAPPIGRGYDCGLRAALEICRLLDRAPGRSLADLRAALPPVWATPMLAPACPDTEKYGVIARLTARLQAMAAAGAPLAGRRILSVLTVNGARAALEGGGWILLRASSNTPNLVLAAESPDSAADLSALVAALNILTATEPGVAAPGSAPEAV